MIRVLLADDQLMFRRALATFLELTAELHAVAEAADADETLQQLQKTQPDVALLDVQMPGGGLRSRRCRDARIAEDPSDHVHDLRPPRIRRPRLGGRMRRIHDQRYPAIRAGGCDSAAGLRARAYSPRNCLMRHVPGAAAC